MILPILGDMDCLNAFHGRCLIEQGDRVMKRALITGVTGQDGAYLSELLLSKGYEVYGMLRRSSSADVVDARLRWLGIEKQIRFVDGNLTDLSGLIRTLKEVKPDEVYNLGAQSFVKSSWQQPL